MYRSKRAALETLRDKKTLWLFGNHSAMARYRQSRLAAAGLIASAVVCALCVVNLRSSPHRIEAMQYALVPLDGQYLRSMTVGPGGIAGSFNRPGNGAFNGPLTVGPGGTPGSFNSPTSECQHSSVHVVGKRMARVDRCARST